LDKKDISIFASAFAGRQTKEWLKTPFKYSLSLKSQAKVL